MEREKIRITSHENTVAAIHVTHEEINLIIDQLQQMLQPNPYEPPPVRESDPARNDPAKSAPGQIFSPTRHTC
jgi:hypothetical protein